MSQKSLSHKPASKSALKNAARKSASPNVQRRKVQAQKAKAQTARRRNTEKQPVAAPVLASKVAAREEKAQIAALKTVAPDLNAKSASAKPVEKAVSPKAAPSVAKPTAPPSVLPKPVTPFPAAVAASVPAAARPIAPPIPARRWPLWICGGFLALLLIVGGGAFGFYQAWQGSGRIASNIFIAGQPVGGMTRDEALQSLKSKFGKLDVMLVAPDKKWHLPIYNLGGHSDANRAVNDAYWFARSGSLFGNVSKIIKSRFEERHLNLGVRWDKQKLKTRMRTIAADYKQKPRDAALQVNGSGVQIVPDMKGRAMNVGATLWQLQHRYDLHHNTVNVKVDEVKPRLAAADLEGTDVQIGSFTTSFNSGQIGRTRNLHVASAAVNGKVLMPGDTFSFNASTGERTWEKGYRMAHIYERKPGKTESEVVDGLAGGTCQVSTTLYNAVRKGNQKVESALKIVQREMHSLPVPYISSGLDATVAWPNRDFKFQNTLPHPIYLRAAIDGSRITMSIWARVPRSAALKFAQEDSKKPRG